jgi:excisionase family DNA binding protein
MGTITFDQLPAAVSQLFTKLENIETLLQQKQQVVPEQEDDLMTIDEVAEFLKLGKPTIYNLVSASKIPNSKVGKRLYFSRKKILKWIESGERKTIKEIAASV